MLVIHELVAKEKFTYYKKYRQRRSLFIICEYVNFGDTIASEPSLLRLIHYLNYSTMNSFVKHFLKNSSLFVQSLQVLLNLMYTVDRLS